MRLSNNSFEPEGTHPCGQIVNSIYNLSTCVQGMTYLPYILTGTSTISAGADGVVAMICGWLGGG
jgi:hypothetical protein